MMQLYNHLTGKSGIIGILLFALICYLLPECLQSPPQADAALVTGW